MVAPGLISTLSWKRIGFHSIRDRKPSWAHVRSFRIVLSFANSSSECHEYWLFVGRILLSALAFCSWKCEPCQWDKCVMIPAYPQGMTFKGNRRYWQPDFFLKCVNFFWNWYKILHFLNAMISLSVGLICCGQWMHSLAAWFTCPVLVRMLLFPWSYQQCFWVFFSPLQSQICCVQKSCHITEEQSCESLGCLTSRTTQNPFISSVLDLRKGLSKSLKQVFTT